MSGVIASVTAAAATAACYRRRVGVLVVAGIAVLLAITAPALSAAERELSPRSSGSRQRMDVVVGLRWRDQAGLERLLRSITDPDSPEHAHYLTSTEFHQRFAPTDAIIEATRLVLRDHGLGVVDVTPSGLFLTATGWVTDVTATRNALLAALRDLTQEVRLYFHLTVPGTARSVDGSGMGADGAAEMRPPLQAVRLRPRGSESAFTPDSIARAYQLDLLYRRGIKGHNGRSATIAVAGAYGFDWDDIRGFWAEHGIARGDDSVELVWVGGETDVNHLETVVDVQWASALAPESPILMYSTPEPTAHGFLKVYDRITSENRAGIMVTSWGACEKQLSLTYLEQAHILFQRAAAQGITVVAASGDRGADDCQTGELGVDYPAADPNVLAVGGTTLRNDGVFANETAWAGSGGGESYVWAAPRWQMHPSTQRVMADVAFHADTGPGYVSRYEGRSLVVGGTSLGAPSWAALLALANQARTDGGGRTLGLVAPALCEAAVQRHQSEFGFRDITSGDNQGFDAVPGWDFPTGWGTPRAAALVDALTEASPRPLSGARLAHGIVLTPVTDEVGVLRVQLFHQCARTAMRLQGRGLSSGDYTITFNGESVASFAVDGSGRINQTIAGLDPRGMVVNIRSASGGAIFAGIFPHQPEPSKRVVVDLDSTGLFANASGVAVYQRRHGRERFTVNVQNVAAGVYDLRVGNATIAPLTVPSGRSSVRVSYNVFNAAGAYSLRNPLCNDISVLRDGLTVLRTGGSPRGIDLCQ